MNSLTRLDKQGLHAWLSRRDLQMGFEALSDVPHPQAFKDMQKGVGKIIEIMQRGEEVLVVGDYDADGVCASAIMCRFFERLGYENFRLVIPNRFVDGYGVSAKLLEKHLGNARVVVSVDNGITAFCAGEFCKALNIPLIITDHHVPLHILPEAFAIINPQQADCTFPQKEICGAMVAWYVCACLKQGLGAQVDMSEFLEYVAIATIADVMPLLGLNRVIVKKGLARLQACKSPQKSVQRSPIAELIVSKLKHISAQNLAFNFIPLLNCAGRMGSADLALSLLLSRDLSQALMHYKDLSKLNTQRKKIQHEILQSALTPNLESEHFVVSFGEHWHEGVLGIVAAHLSREKGKSAFVLSLKDGVLKGSGRSYGGVNLIASIQALDFLLGYGGHSGAVGLSLELDNIEAFLQTLESVFVLDGEVEEESTLMLESACVDEELLSIVESFEPFGEGNPKPIMMCQNLILDSIKPLGRGETKHFAYSLRDENNGVILSGVEFFAPCEREKGTRNNVYFELMRDEYRGGVSLKIVNLEKCSD